MGKASKIQFSDIFILEDIQRLQDLFSDATGVASIITHPDGTPITMPSNFSRLCNNIIRKTEKGCANCFKSDAAIGRYHPSGPIVQPCLSGGLWDAGASITIGGKHIANWLIGQVRNEELDEQRMIRYADEIGANREDFMEALNEVPVMSVEQFRKISKMLFAFANELSEKAYNNLQLKTQIAERKNATELLKESEEQYRTIFDNVQDVFFQTDLAGIVLDISPSIKYFSEFNRDEIIGTPVYDLYYNLDDRVMLLNAITKNGEIRDYGLKIKTKTGEIKYGSINARLISDIHGNPNYIYGSIRDISERKSAEKALNESRQQLLDIIDFLPDATFVVDNEKKVIIWNKAIEEMTGVLKQDMIGKGDHAYAIPFYGKKRNLFLDLIDTNEEELNARYSNVIEKGLSWYAEIFAPTLSNGKGAYISVLGAPLFNGSGERAGSIESIRDVTDRKRMDEALKNSLALTEATLESIHNGILVVSHQGAVVKTNAKFAEMWRIPGDILALGDDKTLLDYVLGQLTDPDEFTTKVSELYGKPEAESLDLIYLKGGRIFERISKPFYLENKLNGRVWSFLDITERKFAEQELINAKKKAEESDRLKSAFLANMSHEIRTPLNGILGFAEMLKEPDLSGEEFQKYISIIDKSGKRLTNIVDDIISISKIESGQMEISLSETNVNEQIEYIYAIFKPEADQKGVQIFFKNSLPTKETTIKTDREKINVILANLIRNAIKFTGKGHIEFGYEKKGKYLEFYVKDTGTGIRPEQKEFIFERFRQGSESITRNYEGAGLGLSIAKAYVEMLGGKIWVESDEGKGSEFYFTIPFY